MTRVYHIFFFFLKSSIWQICCRDPRVQINKYMYSSLITDVFYFLFYFSNNAETGVQLWMEQNVNISANFVFSLKSKHLVSVICARVLFIFIFGTSLFRQSLPERFYLIISFFDATYNSNLWLRYLVISNNNLRKK